MSLAACSPTQNTLPATGQENSVVAGEPVEAGARVTKSIVALKRGFPAEAFCTGVIISPRVVLTAAHCVEKRQLMVEEIFVSFGPQAHRRGIPQILVDKIVVAPHYNPFVLSKYCPFENLDPSSCRLDAHEVLGTKARADLALLLLEKEIPEGYEPARLADSTLQIPSEANLAGYGLSAFQKKGQRSVDGLLRQMKARTESQPSSESILAFANSTQSICYGDSGGPLYSEAEDEIIVWGIASHLAGFDDSRPCGAQAGAYSSVAGSLSWIQKTLKDIDKQEQVLTAPWRADKYKSQNLELFSLQKMGRGLNWLVQRTKAISIYCVSPFSTKVEVKLSFDPAFQSETLAIGKAGRGSLQYKIEQKNFQASRRLQDPKELERNLGFFSVEGDGFGALQTWKIRPNTAFAPVYQSFFENHSRFSLDLPGKEQSFQLSSKDEQLRVVEANENHIHLKSLRSELRSSDLEESPQRTDPIELSCDLIFDMIQI